MNPAHEIEAQLRARTSPLFSASGDMAVGDIVLPDYDGRSLANVPATLLALLGADAPDPAQHLCPPLEAPYWADAGPIRRLIVVLLDALGYLALRERLRERERSVWSRLATVGRLLPMTSICPSTTATALATLFTGLPPIAHGILGYELWLREVGLLTQMLALRPALGPDKETLLDWGIKPESLMPSVSLGALCDKADIATTALVPAQHVRGALTRMCYRGFYRIAGYADSVDMWNALHSLLGQDDAERSLYLVYWGGIDHTAHRHGTGRGHWQTALDDVTRAAEERFFWQLTRDRRADTAVVLLADHGFIDAPADQGHRVDTDPVFQQELLIPHSGESRLAYLHCLDQDLTALQQRFQATLGEGLTVLSSREAIDAGLFGPGEPHPEAACRLGHLIVASRGKGYLIRDADGTKLRGRHGGLGAQEMLVPWLLARLDAI
jgi:hypothetical protein